MAGRQSHPPLNLLVLFPTSTLVLQNLKSVPAYRLIVRNMDASIKYSRTAKNLVETFPEVQLKYYYEYQLSMLSHFRNIWGGGLVFNAFISLIKRKLSQYKGSKLITLVKTKGSEGTNI